MAKEIKINEKIFNIKELLYLDVIELAGIADKREHAKKLFLLSGLTEDQINNLSISEGMGLMKEINSINGFEAQGDFQKTSGSEKSQ